MLSKKYRLPGNQIPQVLKKGKRYSFPLFNLVVCQQSQLLNSRFAFVASLKISKKAVVRNRTKRLFSEAVRVLLPQIKKNQDIIFFAKKPFREEKLQDVLPLVEDGLKKTRLLKSE